MTAGVVPQLSFQEDSLVENWFPELQNLSSSVTHMDIKLQGHKRVTAIGCQRGQIRCALVDLTTNSTVLFVSIYLSVCT